MPVTYSADALKTLRKMQPTLAHRIRAKMEQYAEDPASLANNVKALVGSNGLRLRVGDCRVIFTEEREVVAVIKIAPRGSAYD